MPPAPFTLTAREPHPGGIAVASELSPPPSQLPLTGSRLVLLIHGYNNTQEDAENSYLQFRVRTGFDFGCPAGELCFFHWPGNRPWGLVSALSYPVEIAPAKESAEKLRDYLAALAANRRGGWPLEISLVCHSLGNRLALDLLRLVAATAPNPDLRIVNFCLMAAAVPVTMVEAGGRLGAGAGIAEKTLVLHSRSDWVLHYAFPLGQTAAGEGFFPKAVGRDGEPHDGLWSESPQDMGTFDYLHGDYWSGKDNGESTTAVATFLGGARPRQIAQAAIARRPFTEAPELPSAHLAERALPARF